MCESLLNKLSLKEDGVPHWWNPHSTYTASVLKKRNALLEELKARHSDDEYVIFSQKKPANHNFHLHCNFRGSRFRGISRNGNSWQILLMINRRKTYLGSLHGEEMAARAYDRAAIQT